MPFITTNWPNNEMDNGFFITRLDWAVRMLFEQHENIHNLEPFLIIKGKEMKTILPILIASICSLATASPGDNCYQISNSDAKNYCLATAKRDKNYCYQISDRDSKNMCLAMAGYDKNYCYQISSSDKKNQCLGQF